MSLVKIEASFDPSNPAQLTAAMNFLSAVGGNVIPSGNQAPADEPKEETPAPKKRAPRKKKTAEVAETPKTTEQPKEETPAPKKETAPTVSYTHLDVYKRQGYSYALAPLNQNAAILKFNISDLRHFSML